MISTIVNNLCNILTAGGNSFHEQFLMIYAARMVKARQQN